MHRLAPLGWQCAGAADMGTMHCCRPEGHSTLPFSLHRCVTLAKLRGVRVAATCAGPAATIALLPHISTDCKLIRLFTCRAERLEIFDEFEEWHLIQVIFMEHCGISNAFVMMFFIEMHYIRCTSPILEFACPIHRPLHVHVMVTSYAGHTDALLHSCGHQ